MIDPDPYVEESMRAAEGRWRRRGRFSRPWDGIVHAATQAIPGVSDPGISQNYRRGQIETLAATSLLAKAVDDVQYEVCEDPCVVLLDFDDEVVQVDDLSDNSWFRHYAAERGSA